MSWEISREEQLRIDKIMVREARRKSPLTQAAFGARYGVSEWTVNQWENGHESPCSRRRTAILRDTDDEVRELFMRLLSQLPKSPLALSVCFAFAAAA